MHRFERRLRLPIPRAELFAWHARLGAFERLAPSWEQISIVERRGTIHDGDRLHFRVHKGPLKVDWVARHCEFVDGLQFVDVAERSPFASWRHLHAFEDLPGGGSMLRDLIELRLPLHRVTWPLAAASVEAMLERMFLQRHLRTTIDLRRHWAVRARGRKSLRITGTSGGARGPLAEQLAAFWTTGGNSLGTGPIDAIVHIGGRSEQLRRSCEARTRARPSVVIIVAASADERDAVAATIEDPAIRVVSLRAGVVVSGQDPLVRGPRSHLEQRVRATGFIDLDDLIGLIHQAIFDPAMVGPLDAVASPELSQRGVELDFPTLDQSLAHQLGRLDPGALAHAVASFEAQQQRPVSRAEVGA